MHGIYMQPVTVNMAAIESCSLESTPELKQLQREEAPEETRKPLSGINEPITKHSARILRRRMLSRPACREDRRYIRELLLHGNLADEESFHILLNLLLTGLQER